GTAAAMVLRLSCTCRAGAHRAENRVATGRTAQVVVRARTGVTTQHVRRQLTSRAHGNLAPTVRFMVGVSAHVGVLPEHAFIHISNCLSGSFGVAVSVRMTFAGTRTVQLPPQLVIESTATVPWPMIM